MRMPRKKEGTKSHGNLWSLNGVVKTRTQLKTTILIHKIIILERTLGNLVIILFASRLDCT